MKCKQVVIPEFGAAEVLAFQEIEIPQPQAGEVLVKVALIYSKLKPSMEINPIISKIKELSERSLTLRGYL
jgi:hypothetical protein